MKAIVITSPGGPEVLQLKEVEDPEIKDDEVLIKVSAAAVSRADTLQRQGKHPPAKGDSEYPGLECSGTVEAVGKDVTRWKLGDQVCALIGGGGYAEKVAVPEGQVLPVPPGVSLQDAASFPEVTCTVWSTIFMMSHLSSGETLLVHGGSSGIGTFAIQIAKHYGARVFVTAGSLEKLVACRDLGADVGINYKTEDFVARVKEETGGKGVDVILDNVGGPYFQRNLDSLSIGGRLFIIGFMGGTLTEVNLSGILARRLTVQAAGLRSRTKQNKSEIVSEVEKNVWPAIAAGKVKPVVYKYLPLDQAAEAHRLMESSQHIGKVPQWISSQKYLSYLDLSKNELQETFPFWLAEMQLLYMILSDNHLAGALPQQLFKDTLTFLDLSRNNFSGELPENIGDANQIIVLMLSENNFFGTLPSSMSYMQSLELLDISKNKFSGDTFPVFGDGLELVNFSSNEFSGEIPATFSKRTRVLFLGNNRFEGALPRKFINLINLEQLDLRNIKIEGEFPKFLSKISTLQILSLRNTSLQGPLPSNIAKLSNLRILDISNNNLTGSIPQELGNITGMIDVPTNVSILQSYSTAPFVVDETPIHVSELIVDWKRSMLALPSAPGRDDVYCLLDLSKNKLSGEIPTVIDNLKGLKIMNMSYNALSGKIPSSFGGL